MNEYAHIFTAIAHNKPLERKDRDTWKPMCETEFLGDYMFGIYTTLMKPEAYREKPDGI